MAGSIQRYNEVVISIPTGEILEWEISSNKIKLNGGFGACQQRWCIMNPRVQAVKPNPDYTITLLFKNGETRCFDVKPYLDKGIFVELKDMKVFNSVRPFLGSIQWKDGQNFCPDTLYINSIFITNNRIK